MIIPFPVVLNKDDDESFKSTPLINNFTFFHFVADIKYGGSQRLYYVCYSPFSAGRFLVIAMH